MTQLYVALISVVATGVVAYVLHLLSSRNNREIALFNVKAEELRRASAFAQSIIQIQRDFIDLDESYPTITVSNQTIYASRLSDIRSELYATIREGDLVYFTFTEEARKSYGALYQMANKYEAYVARLISYYTGFEQGRHSVDDVPKNMTQQGVIVLDRLGKEIRLFRKGKGFPKMYREWWWKKAPLWWKEMTQRSNRED